MRAPISIDDGTRAWRLVLVLAGGITAVRIAALFASPLELYPDEAQYWLWSRALHWGYVSKPPMIAWLIRATTLAGDGEAWVRLSAPLLHGGVMLVLFRTGSRLYGPAVGLLASALYGLMPAVQVSALFIATDAPLMFFLSLAIWAYVAMLQTPDPGRRRLIAAGFGLALGLAFLAKFAAAYILIGVAAHALVDQGALRAWRDGAWMAALAGLAVSFGPNVIWQGSHGFATVAHTAQVNAQWTPGQMFHPGELGGFLLAQFGVLGPVPFAVLIGNATRLTRVRTLEPADRLLLCLTLPAIIIVSIQALISRAPAHWAAAGYLAGVILVAAMLVRWRARGWITATLVLQGAAAALLLVVVAAPQAVDASGNGRRLTRVRGWAQTAAVVAGAARAQAAHVALTAVAVEDRYLFNELAYYGRGYFSAADAPPLRMRPAVQALNEAELSDALTVPQAGRVLIVETAGQPPKPALPGDFAQLEILGARNVRLDPKHTREIVIFVGSGYRAGASGRPTPP